ncbi:MAG: L,D-transpeptidase [Acidobacteria bacterium]|nr:L,D-transpeptidase [Acidobacteriota bacterium]MCL5288147.1 L,D-transpeptidase [Acidobacteriota bacterium]
MRRNNEAANQQAAKPKRHSELSIGLWRVAAVLLLSLAEAHAQERNGGKAAPVSEPQARPERRIVISIPDRKLALIEDGKVVKIYPVAVGAAATPSPSGEFRVRERITNPTYYAPGKVIGPGKENPLGTRWIGLGQRGYGIHGTNEPRSIGKRASHGCIRMRKADVEELFELVRAGDLVELHGTRGAEVAAIFGEVPTAPATKPATKAAPAVVATVM